MKKQNKEKRLTKFWQPVSDPFRTGGLITRRTSVGIKKSLLSAQVVSQETKAYVLERKNKRGSIRRALSGKTLREYKFIQYTAHQKHENIAEKWFKCHLRLSIFQVTNMDLDQVITPRRSIFTFVMITPLHFRERGMLGNVP